MRPSVRVFNSSCHLGEPLSTREFNPLGWEGGYLKILVLPAHTEPVRKDAVMSRIFNEVGRGGPSIDQLPCGSLIIIQFHWFAKLKKLLQLCTASFPEFAHYDEFQIKHLVQDWEGQLKVTFYSDHFINIKTDKYNFHR